MATDAFPMACTIPLVSAYYSPSGRQSAFHETNIQRQARKQFTTKNIGLQRTGDWIANQAISGTSSSSLATVMPTKPRSTLPAYQRTSHNRSSSVSYSPPPQPTRELLYAIPEDSDAYQEPHIFYSTGPHPSSSGKVKSSCSIKPCDPYYAVYLATQIPNFDFSVLAKTVPAATKGHSNHRRSPSLSPRSDLASIPEAEE
jgi:hypothetical protein